MLLHVVRHGQVQPAAPGEIENVDFPKNDRRLSELGRRQATLLAHRLWAMGFAGTIYSSPFFRTVETGHIVADCVDRPVVLCAPMREAVLKPDQMDGFRGATADELRRVFDRVEVPEDFVYPWWQSRRESGKDVEARVGPFIDSLLALGEREALLVGHGTSVQAAMRHMLRRFSPRHMAEMPPTKPWNCALTSFRLRPCFDLLAMVCTEHLPEEAITSNIRPKAEVLRRYKERLDAARAVPKDDTRRV